MCMADGDISNKTQHRCAGLAHIAIFMCSPEERACFDSTLPIVEVVFVTEVVHVELLQERTRCETWYCRRAPQGNCWSMGLCHFD